MQGVSTHLSRNLRGPYMPSMYDTTDPGAIPASVPAPDYVAGYRDGKWQTFGPLAAKYPRAIAVSITAIPLSSVAASCHVCDCEKGDYTPDMAASWAKARKAAGFVPAIYCSLSAWPDVVAACNAVDVTAVDWWIAAYPGNGAALYAGTVAHQFVDHGPYDESVVAAGWQPGRPTAPPAPPPTPKPPTEDEVITSYVFGTQQHVVYCPANAAGPLTHWYYDSARADLGWRKEVIPA